MEDKKPENLKRRGFLLAAGVGSAGAVAAVAVATGVVKEAALPAVTAKADDQSGGDEETRPVRNHYRPARI